MSVRRQINRYKTEPFGRDFDEVLKKAKRFHNASRTFMMVEYLGVWTAAASLEGLTGAPKDAIYYHKEGNKWVRTN